MSRRFSTFRVGLLTAMTLVAEIGDIGRFESARRLCSWSGLTPRVRNSDTKVRHGRITKMGPAAVRFVLGEAAHVAKTKPPFADAYESIRRRRASRSPPPPSHGGSWPPPSTSSRRWMTSSQLIGVPGELEALSALTLELAEFSE